MQPKTQLKTFQHNKFTFRAFIIKADKIFLPLSARNILLAVSERITWENTHPQTKETETYNELNGQPSNITAHQGIKSTTIVKGLHVMLCQKADHRKSPNLLKKLLKQTKNDQGEINSNLKFCSVSEYLN